MERTPQPALVIAVSPEPFEGGVMKRQWRRLRGLMVGLQADGPWIVLELPEPADRGRVRVLLTALRGARVNDRYPYADMWFKTMPDPNHPTRLLVRKVQRP